MERFRLFLYHWSETWSWSTSCSVSTVLAPLPTLNNLVLHGLNAQRRTFMALHLADKFRVSVNEKPSVNSSNLFTTRSSHFWKLLRCYPALTFSLFHCSGKRIYKYPKWHNFHTQISCQFCHKRSNTLQRYVLCFQICCSSWFVCCTRVKPHTPSWTLCMCLLILFYIPSMRYYFQPAAARRKMSSRASPMNTQTHNMQTTLFLIFNGENETGSCQSCLYPHWINLSFLTRFRIQ